MSIDYPAGIQRASEAGMRSHHRWACLAWALLNTCIYALYTHKICVCLAAATADDTVFIIILPANWARSKYALLRRLCVYSRCY